MNISEFADMIDQDIIIHRYSSQNGRWSASFDHGEIKEGIMLRGEYGDGLSPNEALSTYARKIRGKKIVFDAYKERRKEFTVPTDLKGE